MSLSSLHQIELALLQKFIQLCDDNSLTYFLVGGSLLGAVRHHGFIPWDDDLDVGMPRKDYERLLIIADTALQPTKYFLQTPFSDRNYGMSYAKLIDTSTTIEEINNVNNALNGVFLDVFPFDKIPTQSGERTAQIAKYKFYDSAIILRLGYTLTDGPIHKLISPTTYSQFEEISSLKRKRNDILTQFNQRSELTDYKNLASQYAYDKEIMHSDEISDQINAHFETLTVKIPTQFDVILTRMYGDYLKLPPESSRTEKHLKTLKIK